MTIYTIGFTKKSAEQFFGLLERAGVRRVIDVRLRNNSQLAGFAKKGDLAYLLCRLAGIEYVHELLLAPTPEILDGYRKRRLSWDVYEERFLELMKARQVEQRLSPEVLADACLLCSEARPERCHRRLVAEYLQSHWRGLEIVHL
jgi:uncharacterized protein (DUF488 family)